MSTPKSCTQCAFIHPLLSIPHPFSRQNFKTNASKKLCSFQPKFSKQPKGRDGGTISASSDGASGSGKKKGKGKGKDEEKRTLARSRTEGSFLERLDYDMQHRKHKLKEMQEASLQEQFSFKPTFYADDTFSAVTDGYVPNFTNFLSRMEEDVYRRLKKERYRARLMNKHLTEDTPKPAPMKKKKRRKRKATKKVVASDSSDSEDSEEESSSESSESESESEGEESQGERKKRPMTTAI